MRCRLFSDGRKLSEVKKKGGGSTTALTGDNTLLKQNLKECLRRCVDEGGLRDCDVEVVMLSGTITSNVGVYHAHHLRAPVGPEDSARGAQYVTLPEISAIPMLFIPGVRTDGDPDEADRVKLIDSFDSMSGEECETFGIAAQLGLSGDYTISLPGSYSKTLYVDPEGRISGMSTGMCGEFMTALAENTLIRRTLPHPVIREIIPEKLCEGFDYARARGVSSALAKSRIMQVNCGYSIDEAGNFFAGASLHDDVMAALREVRPGRPLIIGGGNPFRHAMYVLTEHAGCDASQVYEISDPISEMAPVVGQLAVWKHFSASRKK